MFLFSYVIMVDCWQREPQMRPTFAQMSSALQSLLHDQDNSSNNALVGDAGEHLPQVFASAPPGEKC